MKHSLFLALLFLVKLSYAQTTSHRFAADVAVIKSYDKMFQTPANPIVFVGSSSIRKWETLQMVFGSYNVINRGIGGAIIEDIIYYLDDLVFAYKPRKIVLYVGENNLPDEKNTPDSILNKTITLINSIRAKLPEVPIVYISMKPSPSRDKYQEKCRESNKLIREYLVKQKNIRYADVFSPMLKNGKSRPELFVGDMLHMNREGYQLWERLVKPLLLER